MLLAVCQRIARDRWLMSSAYPLQPEVIPIPVLSDRWIRRMAQEHGMIDPFVEAQKRDGVISYGLSSYG